MSSFCARVTHHPALCLNQEQGYWEIIPAFPKRRHCLPDTTTPPSSAVASRTSSSPLLKPRAGGIGKSSPHSQKVGKAFRGTTAPPRVLLLGCLWLNTDSEEHGHRPEKNKYASVGTYPPPARVRLRVQRHCIPTLFFPAL